MDVLLQCMQNKDKRLRFFASIGYVPYVEELLAMGADATSKASAIA